VKSGYSPKTVQMIRDQWGMYTRASASVIYPEGNAEALRWISDNARRSGGQDYIVANGTGRFDYRPLLRQIRCPTLLLHREHDQNHRLDEGRQLASHIAGARFVALPGGSHHPMWGCDDYLPILYEFLGVKGSEPSLKPGAISGTAIILFADIVDSTALTEHLGDADFRRRARALDDALRTAIRDHGGTPIDGKLLGDDLLAVTQSGYGAGAANPRRSRLPADGSGGGFASRPPTCSLAISPRLCRLLANLMMPLAGCDSRPRRMRSTLPCDAQLPATSSRCHSTSASTLAT
jgi:hypothetical protein